MTLDDHTPFHLFQWSACTDANGQALLRVLTNLTETDGCTILVEQPAGYLPVGDMLTAASPGQITPAALVLYPLPPVTDTLKAVDGLNGNPLGGACWSYYANDNGTPGALAIGPACDTDNDGATTVSGIAPATAYCLVVMPPVGYQVVGESTICSTGRSDGVTTVKAFTSAGSAGAGSARITAKTQWGAPRCTARERNYRSRAPDRPIARALDRADALFLRDDGLGGATRLGRECVSAHAQRLRPGVR